MTDVELGDKTLRAGERVSVLIGAANRDPEQFRDAGRFDITRDERTIAFGGGIHFCTGAQLARVEGQEALGAMIERMPDLAKAGEPVWRTAFNLRGLDELRVTR
jgi:cytochrome P450